MIDILRIAVYIFENGDDAVEFNHKFFGKIKLLKFFMSYFIYTDNFAVGTKLTVARDLNSFIINDIIFDDINEIKNSTITELVLKYGRGILDENILKNKDPKPIDLNFIDCKVIEEKDLFRVNPE